MIIDSLRSKIGIFQQAMSLCINNKCDDWGALNMVVPQLERMEKELVELRTLLYMKFNQTEVNLFEVRDIIK